MFIKARKGENQFWRYLLTLFIVLIVSQVIGAIPLLLAAAQGDGLGTGNPAELLVSTGLSKNAFLVLMMFPFVVGFLALIWAIKTIHKRTFTETTTGFSKFRWERFFKGFGIWFFLSFLLVVIGAFIYPDSMEWNFQPAQFAILVLISLLFIPLQTGFEEILFRGYLLQGFELLTKNKWLSVVITGLAFSFLHIANPEVAEFGYFLAMSQYTIFGLLFGFMTVMDNGLELAWGAHAANNIFISLFITHEASALQTNALFIATEINPEMDLIAMIIAGSIFLGICWKLFNWTFEERPEIAIADEATNSGDELL